MKNDNLCDRIGVKLFCMKNNHNIQTETSQNKSIFSFSPKTTIKQSFGDLSPKLTSTSETEEKKREKFQNSKSLSNSNFHSTSKAFQSKKSENNFTNKLMREIKTLTESDQAQSSKLHINKPPIQISIQENYKKDNLRSSFNSFDQRLKKLKTKDVQEHERTNSYKSSKIDDPLNRFFYKIDESKDTLFQKCNKEFRMTNSSQKIKFYRSVFE